jgi:radical SAM superfamily enzyme YgiQ (UPF0313 family)
MSNLGFQTVYRLFNEVDDVVCERAFLPEGDGVAPRTVESASLLTGFDIVAFSVSFENDYPNLLAILSQAGIPPASSDRQALHPLVMAGGVACFLNPEPLSAFVDCFLIGEAEALVDPFFRTYDPARERQSCLASLARSVAGVYVPRFYAAAYREDGTLRSFEPLGDVPERIPRAWVKDLSAVSTCTSILTPDTSFEKTFLVEVSRGCPHGCRFCTAGYVYRPPRYRPLPLIRECFEQGSSLTDKVGLVGAAVSDWPEIKAFCAEANRSGTRILFSSLRADTLSPALVEELRKSGVKTATIAPDAGSQRMRDVINKGLSEEEILSAAESLVAGGIPNLKLYFMVGLPTEQADDLEAIVDLVKRIKSRFLSASRDRRRIGTITASINSFVPKPFTPFQWAAMDDVASLKGKIRRVREGLRRVPNVRIHGDVPRRAYIQALLSRGDRNVSRLLALVHENRENWAAAFKDSSLNPDFYVTRERRPDEVFPWDFIDHGIRKAFLRQEYERAGKAKVTSPCDPGACNICGVCSA